MKKLIILTVCTFLAFGLFAQSDLLPDSKSNLWLSAGWGAEDGDISSEVYPMVSLGMQLEFPQQVFIVRGVYGEHKLFASDYDYRMMKVSGLWGYAISDEFSSIHFASGVNFSKHREKISQVIKPNDLNINSVYHNSYYWGVPLEIGVKVYVAPKTCIGGTVMFNWDADYFSAGYLVQVHQQFF
jgi:hypothetical protein